MCLFHLTANLVAIFRLIGCSVHALFACVCDRLSPEAGFNFFFNVRKCMPISVRVQCVSYGANRLAVILQSRFGVLEFCMKNKVCFFPRGSN